MNFRDWMLALFRNCKDCEFVDVLEDSRPWMSRGCVEADYWSPSLSPESRHHCRWFRWLSQ